MHNLIIILCRPENSQNIGACCRALMTMGVSHLRIVGKKEDYSETEVKRVAVHATAIWENAVFFPSLQQAIADCTLATGFTKRRGKKRKQSLLLPEEFATKALQAQGFVAAVFGNEKTGLTDEELNLCTTGGTIPSNPDFGSLNLSHAVQVITYTYFREKVNKGKNNITISPSSTPLSIQNLQTTTNIICNNLKKIGFFSLTGKNDMERFWLSLCSRAMITKGESAYLEKIFKKIAGLLTKKQPKE